MTNQDTGTIGRVWADDARADLMTGWRLGETSATLSYCNLGSASSRAEALEMGVPASVLDRYEGATGGVYDGRLPDFYRWLCRTGLAYWDHDIWGWRFAETGATLTFFDACAIHSRAQAAEHGVPSSVLDQYEAVTDDGYGSGGPVLAEWLAERRDWF